MQSIYTCCSSVLLTKINVMVSTAMTKPNSLFTPMKYILIQQRKQIKTLIPAPQEDHLPQQCPLAYSAHF